MYSYIHVYRRREHIHLARTNVHTYIHTYMCTVEESIYISHARTYIHTYIHVYRRREHIHTHARKYIHAYIHVYRRREHMHTHARTYARTSMCIHSVYMYVPYMYTECMHTYMYTENESIYTLMVRYVISAMCLID